MNADDEVWREAEGRWWVDADGNSLRVDHPRHPFLLGPSIAGEPTATLGLAEITVWVSHKHLWILGDAHFSNFWIKE